MIDVARIDEMLLNDFRDGYLITFLDYHAKEFGWTTVFTRSVTRDALRFLGLSAIPLPDRESPEQMQVMVCSPIVDKIVDAIFLDSPLLVWLERNIFHTRLLHVPYYAHGETNPVRRDLRYSFTLALMRNDGYNLHPEIWPEQLPANYKECIGGCPPPCHVYAIAE